MASEVDFKSFEVHFTFYTFMSGSLSVWNLGTKKHNLIQKDLNSARLIKKLQFLQLLWMTIYHFQFLKKAPKLNLMLFDKAGCWRLSIVKVKSIRHLPKLYHTINIQKGSDYKWI